MNNETNETNETHKVTKIHCSGCYNDFYNHRTNFNGENECWSLKGAKLITLYAIHRDTPQDKASNFRIITKPNCYMKQDFSYRKELPDHLK